MYFHISSIIRCIGVRSKELRDLLVRSSFFYLQPLALWPNWYWTSKTSWRDFRDEDLVYYTFLIGYMIVRLFGKGLEDAVNKNVATPFGSSGPILYEKFTFIWR